MKWASKSSRSPAGAPVLFAAPPQRHARRFTPEKGGKSSTSHIAGNFWIYEECIVLQTTLYGAPSVVRHESFVIPISVNLLGCSFTGMTMTMAKYQNPPFESMEK